MRGVAGGRLAVFSVLTLGGEQASWKLAGAVLVGLGSPTAGARGQWGRTPADVPRKGGQCGGGGGGGSNNSPAWAVLSTKAGSGMPEFTPEFTPNTPLKRRTS